MKRCFEQNGAAKDFHFKKKNQFEKKIGDHLELRALAFNLGWSPIFYPPPQKFHFMSVILIPCLFPVIHPKQVMDLEKIENSKKSFKNSGFHNPKTLNFYNNVIYIFSRRFTGRFFNYPVDEEVFWKKWRGRRLWLKAKYQFEKKIGYRLDLKALAP